METGAGGIYTTADDLLRWNKALDAPGFLSAQGLDFMFTPHPPGNFGGTSLIRVSGCVWVGLTLILMFAALAVVLWLLKGPKGPNAAN